MTDPGFSARISSRVRRVMDPPISEFKERHHDHLEENGLIDLSQAVPSYAPPPAVAEAVAASAGHFGTQLYTPDPGLPECREAVVAYLRSRHGANLETGQLIVTPGANAAFHFAAGTLFEPGERTALFSPYYFNHAMSVELLGGIVCEVPWRDELPLEMVERTGARMAALATPGNPSGRALPAEEVRSALRWARSRGVTLVFDETYLEFPASGAARFSVLSIEGWQESAVVVGSFSKSLALTGYRVGYLCAAPELIRHALKMQDAVVICAPRIGQIALAAALRWDGLDAWIAARRAEIEERVTTFTATIVSMPGPFRVEHSGAFFAWLRHDPVDPVRLRARLQAFGHYHQASPDEDLVADLLVHQARVLALPGRSAGVLGADRIRVAVGNAAPRLLREAAERIQNAMSV